MIYLGLFMYHMKYINQISRISIMNNMTATGLLETAAIDAVFGRQFAGSSATHQHLHPRTGDSSAAT
jgi:hypothetical protein